jgi:hypothetical protein
MDNSLVSGGASTFSLSRPASLQPIRLVHIMKRSSILTWPGFYLERGLWGVAAPVFMSGSHLVAAVGIAGSTGRISRALGSRTSELPVAIRGTIHDPFS